MLQLIGELTHLSNSIAHIYLWALWDRIECSLKKMLGTFGSCAERLSSSRMNGSVLS